MSTGDGDRRDHHRRRAGRRPSRPGHRFQRRESHRARTASTPTTPPLPAASMSHRPKRRVMARWRWSWPRDSAGSRRERASRRGHCVGADDQLLGIRSREPVPYHVARTGRFARRRRVSASKRKATAGGAGTASQWHTTFDYEVQASGTRPALASLAHRGNESAYWPDEP